jgi:hypothetical protein
MNKLLFAGSFLAISAAFVFAIDKSPTPLVTAHMVVTVEARHGGNVPVLKREDFIVARPRDRFRITDAVPLTGAEAATELYILIDEASNFTLAPQLADLRRFIEAQPGNTAVGVGYMHYGGVETVADPTRDHTRAAKALRLPLGLPSSPFLSLSALIKRWPEGTARRAVVMITSGADPLGETGVMNPYLDAAIEDAQRAQIMVSAIYTPAEGHAGHRYWKTYWGQNYISELADETGGEAYMLGFGPVVAFEPYLNEITERMAHQYRLTLMAVSSGKPELTPIQLTTEVPNAEIVAASKVYVAPSNALMPASFPHVR